MKVFICYDTNQKKYFEKCGFKDILTGLHKTTYKQFWLYERNEKFNKCFEDWLSKKIWPVFSCKGTM